MHIVLVEPEIPPNTGNIARLCAGINATLHLVQPLGFAITDREVRRAGLDYWDKVKIVLWDNLADFLAKNSKERLFFFSTKAKKLYTEIKYQPQDYLVFGKETKGLPADLICQNLERAVTIPLNPRHVRSLNLANSVAIAAYEALRQNDFVF
ncbi:tRNA (cytidine(34)-2'-O)-methyltransferase TrmL [Candidatus Termititenax persephonae]|uniref:Putative tRNA (cytidine(34)-2'-O)-methyltransferase n=1 Tax=Candidatus Termititenax persephonae TaxID=2218525 RepID=A0A388TJ17_9BACT|nr:tRNA (cytidine(34)-2'-O)-methyltransferase TrmL [Candidatus Termititenax persephonae]